MKSGERTMFLFLRGLLSTLDKSQQRVVLDVVKKQGLGIVQPKGLVAFLETFCGKELVKSAFADAELHNERIQERLMRKRVLVGFPSTKVCVVCLNYEATHNVNTCRFGHKTVCYGCYEEEDEIQSCCRCKSKEKKDAKKEEGEEVCFACGF